MGGKTIRCCGNGCWISKGAKNQCPGGRRRISDDRRHFVDGNKRKGGEDRVRAQNVVEKTNMKCDVVVVFGWSAMGLISVADGFCAPLPSLSHWPIKNLLHRLRNTSLSLSRLFIKHHSKTIHQGIPNDSS